MLSYQHGFHAGNRADVLKHAVLDAILRAAAADPRPLLYVETHSGRGRYDLMGAQARKKAEADAGVIALMQSKAPRPLRPWLDAVTSRGTADYPGSPALAQALLPASARMIFFEKHPAEHAALAANLAGESRALVRHADGYAGALKLAPRGGERILVFVDPSYETSRDIDALALWTPKALKRWPGGMVVLWLPLFRDGREAEFGQYLNGLDDCLVAGARWPVEPEDESALEGSAIVAFRAPEAAHAPSLTIASALQSWWAQAAVSGTNVTDA